MSFKSYAHKVKNPDIPIQVRLSALRSCALRLSWLLKKEKRSEVLGPITQAFNLDDLSGPTEQEICSALMVLENNRKSFLTRLRGFEQRRVEEKRVGKRKPSANDIRQLYEFDLDIGLGN